MANSDVLCSLGLGVGTSLATRTSGDVHVTLESQHPAWNEKATRRKPEQHGRKEMSGCGDPFRKELGQRDKGQSEPCCTACGA